MRTEEWRACPGFPDYQVSSHGRVRRVVIVRGKKPGLIKPWNNNRGYAVVGLRLDGKTIKCLIHRLVGKAFLGLTDDIEIDHRFHDVADFAQMRIATRSQNQWNARGQANCSSKYKGVSWCREKQRWYACIAIDGRTKSLGRFDSEVTAALAYDKAASDAWGEFAYLNFPKLDVADGGMVYEQPVLH